MAKISHNGTFALTLPSGMRIARSEVLDTSNAALRQFDNARFLAGMILSGEVTVEYDADPDPDLIEAAPTAPVEPVLLNPEPAPAETAPVDTSDASAPKGKK